MRRGVRALILGALAAGLPSSADADEESASSCSDEHPCPKSFELEREGSEITALPTTLRLQTRVLQGELPVGDARFDEIWLLLLGEGGEELCAQQKLLVDAKDSVLEVSLEETNDCKLETHLRERGALRLQLCVGKRDTQDDIDTNCLEPFRVGSVPFAVRAGYAVHSQKAHAVNVAAQCHYAERLATGPLEATEVTPSHFAFRKPEPAQLGTDFGSMNDGFIQWTPAAGAGRAVHLCGTTKGTDGAAELDEAWLDTARTWARGDVLVSGAGLIKGSAYVGEGLGVVGDTTIGDFDKGDLDPTKGGTLRLHGVTRQNPSPTDPPDLEAHGPSRLVGAGSAEKGLSVTATGTLLVEGTTTLAATTATENAATRFAGGALVVSGTELDVLGTADAPTRMNATRVEVATLLLKSRTLQDQTLVPATVSGNRVVVGSTHFVGHVVLEGVVNLRDTNLELNLAPDSIGEKHLRDWSVGRDDLSSTKLPDGPGLAVGPGAVLEGSVESRHIQSLASTKLLGDVSIRAERVEASGIEIRTPVAAGIYVQQYNAEPTTFVIANTFARDPREQLCFGVGEFCLPQDLVVPFENRWIGCQLVTVDSSRSAYLAFGCESVLCVPIEKDDTLPPITGQGYFTVLDNIQYALAGKTALAKAEDGLSLYWVDSAAEGIRSLLTGFQRDTAMPATLTPAFETLAQGGEQSMLWVPFTQTDSPLARCEAAVSRVLSWYPELVQ